MKICVFDDWRVGVVDGDEVVDITEHVRDWAPSWPYAWMLTFIAEFNQQRAAIVPTRRGLRFG
jgi:hypothetical protein